MTNINNINDVHVADYLLFTHHFLLRVPVEMLIVTKLTYLIIHLIR